MNHNMATETVNNGVDLISTTTSKTTATLYCPTQSTYISTLTALARSQGGKRAAEQAKALLEDMERVSKKRSKHDNSHPYTHLKPTTTCVNIDLYVLACGSDSCYFCMYPFIHATTGNTFD